MSTFKFEKAKTLTLTRKDPTEPIFDGSFLLTLFKVLQAEAKSRETKSSLRFQPLTPAYDIMMVRNTGGIESSVFYCPSAQYADDVYTSRIEIIAGVSKPNLDGPRRAVLASLTNDGTSATITFNAAEDLEVDPNVLYNFIEQYFSRAASITER
jgi:hypothetical protein